MTAPPTRLEGLRWPHLRPPAALGSDSHTIPPWLSLLHDALTQALPNGALPWEQAQLDQAMAAADRQHKELYGTSVPQRRAQPGLEGPPPTDEEILALPSTLMHQALVWLKQARGLGGEPPVLRTGWEPHVEAMAFQLLARASVERSHQGAKPGAPWALPQTQQALDMTLLIIHGGSRAPVGAAVALKLCVIRLEGAQAALLPAPEQLLTPVTTLWADGLRRASAWWQHVLAPHAGALNDLAVVWSIVPRGEQFFGQLQGDSSSAAMALGGLALLARALPSGVNLAEPWASPLRLLGATHFQKLYLSAAVADAAGLEGELAPIGHAREKSQVLRLARQAMPPGEELPLHTARISDALAQEFQARPHRSLLGLARELCLLDLPDTPAQTALAQALRMALEQANPERPIEPPTNPCPEHRPPRLDVQAAPLAEVLDALAHPNKKELHDVHHLAHLALHRWAVHGRQQGGLRVGRAGQLHSYFVNLQLKAAAQPFNTLEQLLADPRVCKLDAVIVEGEPGSGKSWLMMRHEQALCEQIIAAHGRMRDEPATQPGEAPPKPVLPLFLALKDLPAEEEDPVAWAQQTLLRRYPKQQMGLDHLFNPNQPRRYGLRVLVDGLNEVKVKVQPGEDPAFERGRRVNEVVMALKRALRPDFPMVLGTRPGYDWKLEQEPGVPLLCETAAVLRWSRSQIRAYIDQRWPHHSSAERDAFMAGLPKPPEGDSVDPASEKLLLGLPLFLNMQCELWEAGARQLTEKPSHLLASMLWLRLDQAYQQDAQAQEHVAAPGMLCATTEVPRARSFCAALQSGRPPTYPPVFPRRGLLLQGLFALAKAQWLHHAEQPSELRGEVAIPLALVRQVLDPLIKPLLPSGLEGAARLAEVQRLTQRWLDAVKAIGLAQADVMAGTLSFAHQVFGEWLAAQQLFYSGASPEQRGDEEEPQPLHWPAEKLAQLLQEISPPPLERTAEAELAAQRAQAAQAWAQLPEALFQRWLDEGISLDESECLKDLEWARRNVLTVYANVLEAYQNPPHNFLSSRPSAQGVTWTWNVKAFGEFLDQQAALPARPADGPWWQHRHLWAVVITHSNVLSTFSARARVDMEVALGGTSQALRQVAHLWTQRGRLRLPPPGPLDDILPLALDGLRDASPWWQWLSQVAEPRALGAGLPDTSARRPPPWAVLSACLGQLQASPPTPSGADSVWHAHSARHLLQVVLDAWGHDPRQRIQAGLALGLQGPLGSPEGDHLRYERVARGVRLRRHDHRGQPQWVACGGPGQVYRLSADAQGSGPLAPAQSFERFEVAAYPVTVGEFEAFLVYPGALDPEAAWWRAAGPQAQAWVAGVGRDWRPGTWHNSDFNNPLQPVTGVTAWAADAYVHWAQAVLYAGAAGFEDGLRLALPTEWQLEVAVRGPTPFWQRWRQRNSPYWPGHKGKGEPSPMLFNHVETGWGQPSPVGCFRGSTTAQGLADGAGNVWAWCANTVERGGQSLRALRGGSVNDPARRCAAGVRDGHTPDYDFNVSGFRLGRVVVA